MAVVGSRQPVRTAFLRRDAARRERAQRVCSRIRDRGINFEIKSLRRIYEWRYVTLPRWKKRSTDFLMIMYSIKVRVDWIFLLVFVGRGYAYMYSDEEYFMRGFIEGEE